MFRRRALLRKAEPEPIDALLRVTAPHEWAIVTGLVVALIAAVAWGMFGRVAVNLTVDGVLARPGERIGIVSAVSGSITEVLVESGDSVAAQAPVATLEPPGLEMQVRIARTKEELLADLLERAGETTAATVQVALAEAQAERLQLTALRTAGSAIVSPRAGVITATHVVPGDTVAAGATIADLRSGGGGGGGVTAVAFLSSDQARTVQPGMTVRVLVEQPDGGGQRALQGAVLTVSESGRLPAWLAAAPLAAARTDARQRGHLVTFSVTAPEGAEGTQELQVDDLRPCRLEIVQQRVAPFALLTTARG